MPKTSCSDLAELELESELIPEMEAKLESLKLEHSQKLEQQNEEQEKGKENEEKEKEKEKDRQDVSSRRRRSFSLSPDRSNVMHVMPTDVQMHMARAALQIDDDDSDDVTDDDDDDEDSAMLSFASSGRWKPMFNILEADPTEIGAKTKNEWNTALHVAARFDDLPSFKRLVGFALKTKDKKGKRMLSISDKNKYGETPLHLAAQLGNPNVASYLTKKKPRSAYELNHQGFSPLYFAVKNRHHRVVEDIFTALPPSDVPKEILVKVVRSPEASLAHAAIQASDLPMLILLLSHLPSVLDTPNTKGLKPLSYAAYRCCVNEVGFILENFPHCAEEPDEDGSFPIHKAVMGGEIGVVGKFLSLCPATVSQRDKKQRTILHVTAKYGKKEVLKYLSKKHSDKFEKLHNSRDVDGKTFKDLAK